MSLSARWASWQRPARAQRELTDEFLESYVCWREACADVRGAYLRWGTSDPPQSRHAFEGYRAALQREEHAARVYCDRAEQVLATSIARCR